jgi:hypothetical protein
MTRNPCDHHFSPTHQIAITVESLKEMSTIGKGPKTRRERKALDREEQTRTQSRGKSQ